MIKSDYNLNYLESSELSLSAALMCLGFTLDSLDKTNPKRIIFIFKRNENLDLAARKFWERQLLVEPLAFFETQRYLKSRIYGGQHG